MSGTPLILSNRFRGWYRKDHWIEFHDKKSIAAILTYQYYSENIGDETADKADHLEVARRYKTRNGASCSFDLAIGLEKYELAEKVAWIRRECEDNKIPCTCVQPHNTRGQQPR